RKEYYLPLVGLARMYRQAGNRAQALEHVTRALTLRPYDAEARYIHGELLYEDGKLEEAQVELERVEALAPHHLGARRALVLVHAARGASPALASELEGLLALEPEDVDARLDLGAAYQRLGELEKATSAYEAVLERRPHDVVATKAAGDLWRAR